MTRFAKLPLSLADQVGILRSRGMHIPDTAKAEQALGRLNYYRLSAYWHNRYTDASRSQFQPGLSLDDILSLYEFDRRLRLRVLDAIERYEIALRTQFAYHLAHAHNPWAYEESALFRNTNSHQQTLKTLDQELARSKESFIEHYRQNYSTPARPPIWMVCEILSFGALSHLFGNLKSRPDRQAIAQAFNQDETVLTALTQHLSLVRNVCAHHSRLWNRQFIFPLKLPTHCDADLRASLNYPTDPKKPSRNLYNTLVLLAACLNNISDDARWRHQVITLLDEFPVAKPSAMGFPTNWRERPLWAAAGAS